MKGILTTICAFTLIGSVIPITFPNDLYYHHHPNLAVADAGGRGGHVNNRYAYSNGHSNGRNNYHNPPHRNAYHNNGGSHHRNSGGHRNPYIGKRGYEDQGNSQPNGNIVYTKDGGIDWSKSKVSKVAASLDDGNQQQQAGKNHNENYDDQQQQQQRGRNFGTSPNYENNQRNPFSNDNGYGDQQQQPSGRYYNDGNYGGNNRDNSYDSYSNDDYYDNSGYNNQRHRNDNGYSSNNYNDDYYDDGNGYYNDNNNNYGDGYDDNNNNNNNAYNNNQKFNSNGMYSSGRNAYTSADGGAASFAGGIRLAGTLPDDGYSRGEGTYYDLETHITTCGKQSKNTEFVAALNAEDMGDSSSKNKHCGKDVEITGPSGKTTQVTIVDSCKTCKKGGLDLSPAAFEEIGDFSQGSIPIKWKFV